MFSNREIATAIILASFFATFLIAPSLRRDVGPSFAAVMRALLAWRLLLLFASYGVYVGAVVTVAHAVGGWDRAQLKDTVLIAVFYGFPLLMGAHEVRDGGGFLRSAVSKIVGFSAIAAFYVSLESLPLWGELIVQPIAALAAATAVVASHSDDESQRNVGRLLNRFLIFLGVSLFSFTTWRAVTVWDEARVLEALGSFALSAWLGVALVPFVYSTAYLMHVGQILTMLPFQNDGVKPSLMVRMTVATGLRGSARLAAAFTGEWRYRIARSTHISDAQRHMRAFRDEQHGS